MPKFMIHVYKDRKWYVDEFLIPSMLKQGISLDDIDIMYDDGTLGCLEACMEGFRRMPDDDNGTWHMQDDVIICHDFLHEIEDIETHGNNMVCGYCWRKDLYLRVIGRVTPESMWWSFPCIRIPNKIAHECGEWFFNSAKDDPLYRQWVIQRKFDDYMFKMFLEKFHKNMEVINYSPNLVDHIDFLIGRSIVNRDRERVQFDARAAYFKDDYLVEELKVKIRNRLHT